MIVLGIILLIAGFLLKVSILWTIGAILVVIGLVLTLLGSTGRAVGGRRTYYGPAGDSAGSVAFTATGPADLVAPGRPSPGSW